MYVVVWVYKYNAMDNNNKNSLLELQNSIETAESNKCSLLVLLCDKWHTSERFVKGETEIWQLWWLVTNFLALLSVPWRRGWTTQKHVCICCTSFSLAHTQPPLTYTSSQKVLTLPSLPLSLSCADGGGNSTHAGWEKWHPHQNSEKFSNQDSQCFFRWVFSSLLFSSFLFHLLTQTHLFFGLEMQARCDKQYNYCLKMFSLTLAVFVIWMHCLVLLEVSEVLCIQPTVTCEEI